jgi:hypothetical protein
VIIRPLLAASVLMAAAPSFAQSIAPVATQTAGAPKPAVDPNKKIICKTNAETGSRIMGHRVCLPASEWAAKEEMTREQMDRVQSNTGTPH